MWCCNKPIEDAATALVSPTGGDTDTDGMSGGIAGVGRVSGEVTLVAIMVPVSLVVIETSDLL